MGHPGYYFTEQQLKKEFIWILDHGLYEMAANKGMKQLMVLGAAGAAAAAGYFYYEKEDHKNKPGPHSKLQPKSEPLNKPDEKPVSPPGTTIKPEPQNKPDEKPVSPPGSIEIKKQEK